MLVLSKPKKMKWNGSITQAIMIKPHLSLNLSEIFLKSTIQMFHKALAEKMQVLQWPHAFDTQMAWQLKCQSNLPEKLLSLFTHQMHTPGKIWLKFVFSSRDITVWNCWSQTTDRLPSLKFPWSLQPRWDNKNVMQINSKACPSELFLWVWQKSTHSWTSMLYLML